MTASQLGESLKVTAMGARQHLTSLERDELIVSQFVRQKTGRPSLYYQLAPKAAQYFPQRYDRLALSLIRSLVDLEGREKVEKVLRVRRERTMKEYRSKLNGGRLQERVRDLAALRDQEGYMAECEEQEASLSIIERNCPIQCVAQEFPEVCQHELELFKQLLGRPVERVEHIIQGQRACIYKICKVSSKD